MDVSGTERAVMVGLSRGGQYLLELARLAPERVAGAVFIAPIFPLHPVALVDAAQSTIRLRV
jgi:pimeloyl-ACP methyl ester carboxylesterase